MTWLSLLMLGVSASGLALGLLLILVETGWLDREK